jgi:hypothetical protein
MARSLNDKQIDEEKEAVKLRRCPKSKSSDFSGPISLRRHCACTDVLA